MSTLKHVGACCPKCLGSFCAEYAQKDQPARWTCHACGATGDLVGELSIRQPATPAPAAPPKQPPPWARNLTRSRI